VTGHVHVHVSRTRDASPRRTERGGERRPGVRVLPALGRLWLAWPPPVGTLIEPSLGDLFGGDPTAPSPLDGKPADVDRVAVCWDGRHRVEWVDPADLVPATAVVAVA